MSGKKAKLQRKLEREKYGTDTVQFKRKRTETIVGVRKKVQQEAREKAEAIKAQVANLATRPPQDQNIRPRPRRLGVAALVGMSALLTPDALQRIFTPPKENTSGEQVSTEDV